MGLFGPSFKTRKEVFTAYTYLDSLLERNGFKQVPLGTVISPNVPSEIIGEHEVLYNRVRGSNYFVYVKLDDDSLKVLYTNPDTSSHARYLPRNQVQILQELGSDRDEYHYALSDILDKSSRKPLTSFYAMLHGHYGSINGVDLWSKHIDDGESDASLAIRNMILYNFDIDATGHHNHFVPELSGYIRDLEEKVGIVKMPGLELTFPYKNGELNGPHMNVWFKDFKTAEDFSKNILSNRKGDYSAFAPLITQEEICNYFDVKGKKGDKSLAVGIDHFFTDRKLPGAGMGNRIAMGDWSIKRAFDFNSDYASAIGSFNCGVPAKQTILFKKSSDKRFFRKMLDKEGLSALTPVNMNYVVSDYLAKNIGLWPYIGHDTHIYHPLNFSEERYSDGDYRITRQGRGVNVFNMDHLVSVQRGEKPTPEEIMQLMHSPDAQKNIVARDFLVKDNLGILDVPKSRQDSKTTKLKEKCMTWEMYIRTTPTFAKDFFKNGSSVNR